ncbi:MAG TPA: DUF1156 domain-containing protein [archaeon]|nr:DUF1156 domain-containing protein [archaeon]
MKKKFIEYIFPIKSVGIEGRKEKQNAIGRIPSIHLYFARRPTCAARAIILSSIIPVPSEDKLLIDYFNLIEGYGKRKLPKKISYRDNLISIYEAIKLIFSENSIKPNEIKVFDPFAGGGTFPLEALNLGLNSYASDLNPIAVLIEKATCEYPQKFGKKLVDALEENFLRVNETIEKEMSNLYKNEVHPENEINFFVWVREFKCIECNLIIPLIKNYLLSKKYQWALIPKIPDAKEGDEVLFSIGWPNKSEGTYSRGKVTCPRCRNTISKETVMKQMPEQKTEKIVAVYENIYDPKSNARGSFRIPSQKELKNSEIKREEVINELLNEYPDIDIKFQEKVAAWGIQNYGIDSTLKCFNSRQLIVLTKILRTINQIAREIEKKYENPEFSKAIILYLSFGLSKLADYNSNLTELLTPRNPTIVHTFKRAGLFMKGLYIETNPLKTDSTGGWMLYFKSLKKVLNNLIDQSKIKKGKILIKQMDAMELEYPDESMDFCFTDPPYYDNIPYAASTDFFFGWFKASLGTIFPDLFLTESTPKENELVQDSYRKGNSKNAKSFYEKGMGRAFSEIYRVLKEDGLAIIIFAHKDNNAWQTLLQAIIDSKLTITSTWPVLMESAAAVRTNNVVSLDSVVILNCRKLKREGFKYYDEEFRNDLENKIRFKLERNWRQGFRGADFFLSALGPAFEEFSKFEAILDVKNDNPLKIKEYLKFIDKILVKFSLEKTLGHESSTADAETQLYLIWRASYQLAKLPYDGVWKFTHALGLDDKHLEGKLLKKVRVKSTTVYQCLDTNDRKELFMDKNYSPSSLIDALQYSGYLWSENDISLDDLVKQYYTKYGEEFWYVAQAIINLIPESPESKLFMGLMRKYGKSVKKTSKENKKDKKNIQQTFVIEGNNVIIEKKINKKENK